jgi:hypothetical protein
MTRNVSWNSNDSLASSVGIHHNQRHTWCSEVTLVDVAGNNRSGERRCDSGIAVGGLDLCERGLCHGELCLGLRKLQPGAVALDPGNRVLREERVHSGRMPRGFSCGRTRGPHRGIRLGTIRRDVLGAQPKQCLAGPHSVTDLNGYRRDASHHSGREGSATPRFHVSHDGQHGYE